MPKDFQGKFIVPSTVTEIGSAAFKDCKVAMFAKTSWNTHIRIMKEKFLTISFVCLSLVGCNFPKDSKGSTDISAFCRDSVSTVYTFSNDTVLVSLVADLPPVEQLELRANLLRGLSNIVTGKMPEDTATIETLSTICEKYTAEICSDTNDDDPGTSTLYKDIYHFLICESGYPDIVTYRYDKTFQYEHGAPNYGGHVSAVERMVSVNIKTGNPVTITNFIVPEKIDELLLAIRAELGEISNYFDDNAILDNFCILDGKLHFEYDSFNYPNLDISVPIGAYAKPK